MRLSAVLTMGILLYVTGCGGGGGGTMMQPPSGLTYPAASPMTVGTSMPPLTPSVTGQVSAYAVSPALPSGLTLNAQDGVISGTPTVVAAQATYTVTASNSSGSTTAVVVLAVNDRPPMAGYGAPAYSYTAGVVAQSITPTVSNQGGKVASWSVMPALPAGLLLDPVTGALSGRPTQSAAAATYTVTASNSGGQVELPLSIAVAAAPLLDLGHWNQVTFMRLTGASLLSLDVVGHWALQDLATKAIVVSGDQACTTTPCTFTSTSTGKVYLPVDVAGQTLMVATPTGFKTFDSTTAMPLATVTTSASWFALATDGSYVATGAPAGLTVWSPTSGQVIFACQGNYANANVYAASGAVQVALGAAGTNVIETLAVPSGTRVVSAAFQGQFNTWFIDGTQFLTNQGSVVWMYSNAAKEEGATSLSAPITVGGVGRWFWTWDGTSKVDVYPVGSNQPPAASYPLTVFGNVVGSGGTLGILPDGTASITVVDLSGSSPNAKAYATPIAYGSAYAATSASSWFFGNFEGVVLDGSSLSGQPRFLTYGAALSIAGSNTRYAIATASGSILYFDAATNTLEGTINFASSSLSLSTDGSVLAAQATSSSNQYLSDRTLNIYTLPAATLSNSFPYTINSSPLLRSATLSGSGTLVTESFDFPTACYAEIIATSGGAPVWCDAHGQFTQLALSPDGTVLAASTQLGYNSSVSLYKNAALVGPAPGWGVGWIDNSHLLVNNYVQVPSITDDGYRGATIYDPSGKALSSVMLPELRFIQPASATSVYSQERNAVFSTTTGAMLWTSGDSYLGVYFGAVAGSNVVFESGSLVLVQPY